MTVGESMLEMVGNTPVVKLAHVVPEGAADVFVKLEWFNPTGLYKDLEGPRTRARSRVRGCS